MATWVDDFGQFLIYLGVLVASGLAFFLAFILREGRGAAPAAAVDLRGGRARAGRAWS